MEDMTPPLLGAVREVRWRISSGKSMKESLVLYLEGATSPFAQQVREWWALKNQGRAPTDSPFTSHFQKAFVNLIERGCAGQPTLEHLNALESEIDSAAQAELELFVATLPFKVLLPMLMFQFPAYLLLLLGPVLRELGQTLGG
ncbi:MAG: hypothetical protein ACXVA9_06395 [Bdellovibrionales bacterium]